MSQLDLLNRPSLAVTPARSSPRLWVRRLAIWTGPTGDPFRDVRLHQGLNIVWSPDPVDLDKGEASGALGHGSGKTLFCRLLRFCLGEPRFGTTDRIERVVSRLPEGQVGAEVVLDGQVMSVVRALGHPRGSVAVWSIGLDEVDRTKLDRGPPRELTDWLVTNVITREVAELVPGEEPWLSALAWMSRDQECRYDHPLIWRAKASESVAPASTTSAALGLETVRALVGALDPEERVLQTEEGKLKARSGQLEAEVGRLTWQIDRERLRLAVATEFTDAVAVGPMATAAIEREARRRMFVVVPGGASFDAEEQDPFETWEWARRELSKHEGQRDKLAGIVEATRIALRSMEDELAPLSAKLLVGLTCPICEVPVEEALLEGCRASTASSDLERARQRIGDLQARLQEARESLAGLVGTLAGHDAEVHRLKPEVARLRAVFDRDRRARRELEDQVFEARRLVADVRSLAGLEGELNTDQHAIDDLTSKLEEVRARQKALMSAQKAAIDAISQRFVEIVGRLVVGATGSIRVTGNGLDVDLDGGWDSPALSLVKVLAFDLAVLVRSIEGATYLPAFLVHDSPREADLGASVYRAWFHLVSELEVLGSEPAFQYIVTTTTAPPPDLIDSHVVLRLGGRPVEQRLLKLAL